MIHQGNDNLAYVVTCPGSALATSIAWRLQFVVGRMYMFGMVQISWEATCNAESRIELPYQMALLERTCVTT
jgi:hypothetical protein